MQRQSKTWIPMLIVALACGLFVAGCNEDDNNPAPASGSDLTRVYVQIERLGNPLTSEVFLAKREHGHHNAVGPAADVLAFKTQMETFITSGLGRTTTIATTLTSVLLPDELLVDTSKPGSGAVGWLTWLPPLGGGYGGRKLENDVVDLGLTAVFSAFLDPAASVDTCLTKDNVDANDRTFSATFPYLGAAH